MRRNKPNPIDPEIYDLADAHGRTPASTLEILRELQARRGSLTRRAIDDTARSLGVPAERAFGIATFYSLLEAADAPPSTTNVIRVCDGPACWLRGAEQARAELETEFGREWRVERSSCLGLCDRAPAALIDNEQCGPLLAASRLVERSQWRATPEAYARPRRGETRVLLARAGQVDPDSVDSAIAHGAYKALARARQMSPEAVIETIAAAGLAGRGGAGFPAGKKWRMVAQAPGPAKYVVCNADESEPLVFKDRVLIDADPHQLLEGIAIACYAVGAQEAFIYIRGEYEPQAVRLEHAIEQAAARGLFDALGNGAFQFHLHRGAGAYICGEETALLESLEGRRGEPRVRPPYPTTAGYLGRPTVVNNVETLCAVPAIIERGAEWYRAVGRGGTPGTKLYTLLGHVNRPGLFEASFGLTLRQVIDDFGGGMLPGSSFGLALVGGAAGTVVPPGRLDAPVDFAPGDPGIPLGAGAFLICDQTVPVIGLLRELLHFFEVESCGKCTPCRIGTHQARVLLDGMLAGRGRPEDVDELSRLASLLQAASLCGLGQSAAVPIQSALTHFRQAFQSAMGR